MNWVEVPFEVQKPQEGRRVDSYLALRLRRYSRSQVQQLIADGRVPYLAVRGRKGGSAMTAAAINALASAKE